MSYSRRLSRLERDEEVARRAAGTPINDGSGRFVRNGVIVSAQDNANAAATRARNAAFSRQTGQYADRSGTIDPDAEGRAAYAASMGGGDMQEGGGSTVRRTGGRGMAGPGGGASSSPVVDTTLAIKRAYQDLGAVRTDNREQKINLAKRSGTFGDIRDDWNARNANSAEMDEMGNVRPLAREDIVARAKAPNPTTGMGDSGFAAKRAAFNAANAGKGRVMDEAGNITDANSTVRRTGGYLAPSDPNNPDSEHVLVGGTTPAPTQSSTVLRVGPMFQSPEERVQGIANAKQGERDAASQREDDMARAMGITVAELRRRRQARRLGPSMSTPSA